jgi:hypothetical protein
MKIAPTVFAAAGVLLLATGSAIAASEHGNPPAIAVAAAPSAPVVEVATAPNCLLPGQIHSFGGQALVTPKRAVTLDPSDCTARGGDPITATTSAN